ncbi:phage shock envelope stress response protein PspM [Actinokineospora bangkokensis]|uniref:Uncharacterized protein n=1 Tax=Actinokineospora bangkokensis TaxID=1193682 RepID=A0A1Q9LQ61_9PSEU|nr:hypothetical protein [Actinokineospora bangkokensis]OLR94168.1 hypothetical protein BJP25_10210 [Actinokineospora bangkokensis]
MGSRRDEFFRLSSRFLEREFRDLSAPVLAQVRAALGRRRDERAIALRKRKRSARATRAWGVGTGLGGAGVAVQVAAAAPAPTLVGMIALTAAAGIGTAAAGVKSWRLHRQPLPEAPPPPVALPARDSAAREPVRRLTDAADTLRELLTQLGRTAVVPPEDVEHARRSGAEAHRALDGVAAQLQAVERARDHAPARDKGHLTEGVRALRRQLDEGVDGYCGLVAAAGRALAESSVHSHRPDRHELTDASDRLSALALALRDLAR